MNYVADPYRMLPGQFAQRAFPAETAPLEPLDLNLFPPTPHFLNLWISTISPLSVSPT
jgi:hypothetical protein